MGIFTRFKDIISSNISAMLDKAEDPEKMLRLMVAEMEETLVELKSSCAGIMANEKKALRELVQVKAQADTWEKRARLAVEKGRDDLAKEAIVEKHRWLKKAEGLEQEQARMNDLVTQARDDIAQLEEKLMAAKEKQRLLLQRHRRAEQKIKAQYDIRKADSADAFVRFEKFEQRIERMEAEAGLINPSRERSLEEEFSLLENNVDLDEELNRLKDKKD